MNTPYVVLSLKKLRQNLRIMKECLPTVDIHYAIKALSDEYVINCLHLSNCNFDVATTGEINILEKLSVEPDKCIHTHPIKKKVEIDNALKYGICTFVVDNYAEIDKFIEYKNVAKIILRLSFRAKTALVDLSKKFGCHYEEAQQMLDYADNLGIDVVGLSFHVGSQTKNPDDHINAILKCEQIIKNNPSLKILDIGGGFPAVYDETDMELKDFCKPINDILKKLDKDIKILCEPGRSLVANIGTSFVSIVGKSVRDGKIWYYIDDGVYGTFSGKIYDHIDYKIKYHNVEKYDNFQHCVIAGPTCDSIDVIQEDAWLPTDLKVGDVLYSDNVGAYTIVTASTFNSLPLPKVIYQW